MLHHYSDSDGIYVIGIYSVSKDYLTIKGLIEDMICCDLTKCYTEEYTDLAEFQKDTIIIKPNQFDESFLDLVENGVSLYVIG